MTNIIDKRNCGPNTYCSGQNEKNIYNSIRKLEITTLKAGMTQNAIHLAMNKKRVLKADEYITICNLINVPLDKFVKKTIHK